MVFVKYLSDLLAITEKSKTDIALTCFTESPSTDAYFIVEYFTYKTDIRAIVDDKSGEIITTMANLENPTKEGRDGFNRICSYFIDGYMVASETAHDFEKSMTNLLGQLELITYAKEHLNRDEGLTYNLNKLADIDRFYTIVHKKTPEATILIDFISKAHDNLSIHIKEYLILKELGYEPNCDKLFKQSVAKSA